MTIVLGQVDYYPAVERPFGEQLMHLGGFQLVAAQD